jgi:hypothetical protein
MCEKKKKKREFLHSAISPPKRTQSAQKINEGFYTAQILRRIWQCFEFCSLCMCEKKKKKESFYIAQYLRRSGLKALGVYIQMYRGRPCRGSNLDRRSANPPLRLLGQFPY